jgi:hypothetical protein
MSVSPLGAEEPAAANVAATGSRVALYSASVCPRTCNSQTMQRVAVHRDAQSRLVVVSGTLDGICESGKETLPADARETADRSTARMLLRRPSRSRCRRPRRSCRRCRRLRHRRSAMRCWLDAVDAALLLGIRAAGCVVWLSAALAAPRRDRRVAVRPAALVRGCRIPRRAVSSSTAERPRAALVRVV